MTLREVILRTTTEYPSSGKALGKTSTVIENPEPLTTIDGNFMVGDTSYKQARNNMSERKAKKEFERIDTDHNGELSNSEICNKRERYTTKRIWQLSRSLWSKVRGCLSSKYRQKAKSEIEDLRFEASITNAYKKYLSNEEAKEVRKKYDNKVNVLS